MKKHFALSILTYCIILSACESNQSQEKNGYEQAFDIKFTLKDSIDFEMLGFPVLSDISPSGDLFLITEAQQGSMQIFDKKGGKISEVRSKQGKEDDHGFYTELPHFYNDSIINVNGNLGYFLYDLNGQQIRKLRDPEAGGRSGRWTMTAKTPIIINTEGAKKVLINAMRDFDSYPGEEIFYERYRALDLIDFESETIQNIIPFDSLSMFKNGMGYIISDYLPFYNVQDGKLFIIHGSDPRLLVYDLEENLENIIDLPFSSFYPIKGSELKSFSPGTVSLNTSKAGARAIDFWEDYIFISYFGGYPPEKLAEMKGMSWEETRPIYRKLNEKYYPKILVLDKNDFSLKAEIELPDYVDRESFLIRDGFLYVNKKYNSEIEEDFLRIYQFQVEK